MVVVSSFPAPSFPPQSRFGDVAGHAFSVAIVSFAVSISMGKLFAKKHNYPLDSSQVCYDKLFQLFVCFSNIGIQHLETTWQCFIDVHFFIVVNCLKVICNDFLVVKVNCLSSVFNVTISI